MRCARYGIVAIAVATGFLVGCGGGSGLTALNPVSPQGPGFSRDAGVTARIEVDPVTNTAKVTNLQGADGGRAIWQGNSVSVASAEVFQLPGTSISSRVLRLQFKNNTAIPIGVNEGLIATLATATPEFSTLTEAGVGTNSLTNGAVSAASIGTPRGVWQDADGTVYVAQGSGNGIRKIFNGAVTTIAQGYQNVYGITGDPNGDYIYFIERDRHRIVRLRKDGNEGSVLIGGPNAGDGLGTGAANQFNTPTGITFGGGELFVADLGNGKVKRVSGLSGTPTLSLVMSGVPSVFGVDYGTIQDRPFLAATSQSTGQIYAIDPTTNRNALIRTLPVGVTGVGVNDGRVIVANATEHTITSLRVPDGSNVYNIASWAQEFVSASGSGFTDGVPMRFNGPLLVSTGGRNGFLVADSQNHRLRRVILPNYVPGNSVQPVNISNSDFLTSTGRYGFHLGQLGSGSTTTVDVAFSVQFEAAMTFYVTVSGGTDGVISPDGNTNAPALNVHARVIAGGIIDGLADGQGVNAGIQGLGGLEALNNGSLIIGDVNLLRMCTPTGLVTTVGNVSNGGTPTNGNGYDAQFPGSIYGIDHDPRTSYVYFTSGNQVWIGTGPFSSSATVDPSNFNFGRIAGDSANGSGSAVGDGNTVRFNSLRDIVVDPSGRRVYLVDEFNDRIVVGTQTGANPFSPTDWNFEVYAGTGVAGFLDGTRLAAQFSGPNGLALDTKGFLYVGDNGNARLRMIDTKSGQVTTVAGDGTNGYADGTPGQLSSIRAVDADEAGNVYFYDFVRLRVYRNGRLYTVSGDVAAPIADGYVDGAGRHTVFAIAVNQETGTVYAQSHGNGGVRRIVAFEAVVP